MSERTRFPPCIDCGEPDSGSMPAARCRDCSMDYCVATGACRECHQWANFTLLGGPPFSHDAGCSLTGTEDYNARTPEELKAVRTAMFGWAP